MGFKTASAALGARPSAVRGRPRSAAFLGARPSRPHRAASGRIRPHPAASGHNWGRSASRSRRPPRRTRAARDLRRCRRSSGASPGKQERPGGRRIGYRGVGTAELGPRNWDRGTGTAALGPRNWDRGLSDRGIGQTAESVMHPTAGAEAPRNRATSQRRNGATPALTAPLGPAYTRGLAARAALLRAALLVESV